ncbi:efflux RND transporter periplasmic adaptor subunit [Malikia sp.]|uniref:efflux RND transporter periplasmic adaptor subunit n=1 Tax=Malikia sp. TaxID=2070706 RepID=UPI002620ED79|nr:efflux RND transporter periplasmic adaptor subunit [Malikia sp.]MDD2728850.1 efflux RND transporter periplasmic adaptor subunit [Malikia sp.]
MPVIQAASSRLPAHWRTTLSALGLAALLAACGDKTSAPTAPGAGMPPPEVGVLTVTPGEVGLVTELPGRLEASRVAQVRARAAGILQQRLFSEGSEVKAGQTLFAIDASPYQASHDSAQASLAKAEANLIQASALAERYQPLAEAKAISQQEFVSAQAAQKQAQADVAVARAAVQTARINLGYTKVTAPIAGRIGRALVTEGALVGQGEATPLAVVQQIDPIYVNFTQSADEAMQLRRALESGQLKRAGQDGASVRLLLPDGSEHSRAGKLLFSDLTVDAGSGQVTLRAEVPNPGGLLLPGLYVRVRLEQAKAGNAMALPQQAVTRSAQGDSVMVVAGDGSFGPRPVKIGAQQGGQWIVLDGLKAGEQVMVDGFQKLRGAKVVKPVPWQASAGQPAGSPAKQDGKAAAPAAPEAAAPAKAGAGAAR